MQELVTFIINIEISYARISYVMQGLVIHIVLVIPSFPLYEFTLSFHISCPLYYK